MEIVPEMDMEMEMNGDGQTDLSDQVRVESDIGETKKGTYNYQTSSSQNEIDVVLGDDWWISVIILMMI